ncbi:MAG: hypothetical protein U9Q06_03595 [Nanoarchaeota archaeon]|nr:hypothetical protein [Nanoarchaeota archaeon]
MSKYESKLKWCLENEKRMKITTTILIFCLMVSLTYAFNATTNSYEVGNYHQGISGENASTSSYDFTSTTTHQQPGNPNMTTTSYNANTGWFDVLTNNETTEVEDPPITPPDTGSPGGGGSGGATTTPTKGKFTVNKEIIKVASKVGETIKISLEITNTDDSKLDFKIESNLKDKLVFSEKDFSIEAGKSKIISLTFYSTEDTLPDVYPGEIKISSGQTTKIIQTIFEIESKQILFDVSLDIPSKYKELLAGEELLLQLTLFNLGDVGKVDATITYIIKDFNGQVIISQEEMIAVETQASFSRKVQLPSDLEKGDYVVIVKAKYGTSIGTSSNIFHIIEKGEISFFKSSVFFVILGIILVILTIIVIFEYEHKKLGKSILKYSKDLKNTSKEIKKEKTKAIRNVKKSAKQDQKLNDKLRILKKAYRGGHISKKSYEKTTSRLKNKLK